MKRLLLALVLAPAVAVTSSACRSGGEPRAAANAPSDRDGHGAATFDRVEDEVLRDLAAIDRRIAVRARITPSEEDLRRVAMGALLHEDPTVAVVAGAVDPFSFDARARGLDAVRQKLALLPASGARATERELLGRLVDAEVARLEEERALPRSASSLVRAIVDTWEPPRSEREAAEDDRWLARRLTGLREAMSTPASPEAELDVVRARELDDALDALEHIAAAPGFVATTQELVLVRDTLERVGSKPAASARSDWGLVARRARAQLGVTGAAEELAKGLAAIEIELRAEAEPAIAAAGLGRDALGDALDKQLFPRGACVDAVPGSRVRSIAAPREREPGCHLRRLVALADDARPAARALALAAMHDHVVVAEWALDVARGASTIAAAQGRHRLLVPVLPDTRARLERIALARPVAALGAGETVRILLARGPDRDARARAEAWSALGDVPLDIARNELDRR